MKTIKIVAVLCMILISCNDSTTKISRTTKADIKEITHVLNQSAIDWSEGNLEGYMNAYWKSEKLKFIGSRGITYGWQQTLDNYIKGYPTAGHTGTLTFELLHIDFLANNIYSVIGTYHLERAVGEANGIFTLIFKNIDGSWKIIVDHSE